MLRTYTTGQQKSFVGSSSGQTRSDVSISTPLWQRKVKRLQLFSYALRCRGEENACSPVTRWFIANSSEGLIHFTTSSEPRLTNPLNAWIIALSWKRCNYEAAPKVSSLPFKSSNVIDELIDHFLAPLPSFLCVLRFFWRSTLSVTSAYVSSKGRSNWAANDSVHTQQTTPPPPSACCARVRVHRSALWAHSCL